jgi:hypothetical protein
VKLNQACRRSTIDDVACFLSKKLSCHFESEGNLGPHLDTFLIIKIFFICYWIGK